MTTPAIGARTLVRSKISARMARSASAPSSAARMASIRIFSRETSPALAAPLSTRRAFLESSSSISRRLARASANAASAKRTLMRCSSSFISTSTWPASTRSPSNTRTVRTTPGVSAGTMTANGDGSIHPGACTAAPSRFTVGFADGSLLSGEAPVAAPAPARSETGTTSTVGTGMNERQPVQRSVPADAATSVTGRTIRVNRRRGGWGIVLVIPLSPMQ